MQVVLFTLSSCVCQAMCRPRTQHSWPTTPNIVGWYMLRPFAHPVAYCCAKFESGQTFSPVQTDARLLANNSQHCWEMLHPLARSLKWHSLE